MREIEKVAESCGKWQKLRYRNYCNDIVPLSIARAQVSLTFDSTENGIEPLPVNAKLSEFYHFMVIISVFSVVCG